MCGLRLLSNEANGTEAPIRAKCLLTATGPGPGRGAHLPSVGPTRLSPHFPGSLQAWLTVTNGPEGPVPPERQVRGEKTGSITGRDNFLKPG